MPKKNWLHRINVVKKKFLINFLGQRLATKEKEKRKNQNLIKKSNTPITEIKQKDLKQIFSESKSDIKCVYFQSTLCVYESYKMMILHRHDKVHPVCI